MQITLDEEQMTNIIKDFMSLSNNDVWHYYHKEKKLTITFKGNNHNVQNDLLNWLTVPERKENIDLLKTN